MNRSLGYQWIALLLALLLVIPQGYAQQQSAPTPQPQSPADANGVSQQNEPSLESRPQDPPGQNNTPGDQQLTQPSKPLGTATAPYGRSTGIAASRPAGAVIAPARQRRVRTFLIRVGIVAGAAAAVTAVAVLAHSSPSRP